MATWSRRLAPLALIIALPALLLVVRARGLKTGKRALKKARQATEALGAPTTREQLGARARNDQAAALEALLGVATLNLEQRHEKQGDRVRPALHALFLRGDDLGAGSGSGWTDTDWITDADLKRIVAERAEALAEIERALLDDKAEWRWPRTSDSDRRLGWRARDVTALLGLRALHASTPAAAWRAARAARALPRALRALVSPELLTQRLECARTADEAIAALLRLGRPLDPASTKALIAELSDAEPADLLVRVHHTRMVSLFVDVDLFLRDGGGRLDTDYLSQGGSAAGLWLRRALAGEGLADGPRLARLAAEAAALPDARARLAAAAEVERGWRRWLRTIRTQELYRYGPLPLEQRLQIDDRRRRTLRIGIAAAAHMRATKSWPTGLIELVPTLLPALAPDPLSGALPTYGRASADTVTLTLPPTPLLPETRRTWRITRPR